MFFALSQQSVRALFVVMVPKYGKHYPPTDRLATSRLAYFFLPGCFKVSLNVFKITSTEGASGIKINRALRARESLEATALKILICHLFYIVIAHLIIVSLISVYVLIR